MDIVLKYFKDLNANQLNQLEKLQDLYEDWNGKINVISRNDLNNLYERHILHSLSIAKFFNFQPNTSIIDIGTGGGFPGIPLAILFPEVKFHLIDSIGKKIKVVNAVAEEVGLRNVTAEHNRVQDIEEKYDLVVSRAVTNLPYFVKISKQVLKKPKQNQKVNGILYLKGGDFANELQKIKLKYKIFELSKVFEESFFETKKLVHIHIK